jgi:uncharacterized membrane protein
MNEALAKPPAPEGIDEARQVWQSYSGRWQFWNQVRAIGSGVALAFAAWGLTRLRPTAPKTA